MNFITSARPIQWPDHWSNGGTGITKTTEPRTTEITAAVKAFGDPAIFMKGSELHANKHDLSEFWEFERQFNPQPTRDEAIDELVTNQIIPPLKTITRQPK
jgi:hypothetical protein